MNEEYDYIIGFDFGHGETSVARVNVGTIDPESVNIEADDLYIIGNGHEPKIPSLIGYDVDGNVQLNFDAYQFRFLKVAAYFKAPMVSSKKFPAITEENKGYFRDFVKTVFRRLHEHPHNQDLRNKQILYFVACPSGWNKEQKEEYLKFFTDDCGLPISSVIEESRAAHVVARRKLYEKDPTLSAYGKKIAVLDLGSSTLDITMHSDRTYSDGYEIGASKVEEMLLCHFLSTNEDFCSKYRKYDEIAPSCKSQILFMLRMAKEEYFNRVSNGASGDIALRCQVDWEELSSDEISGISNLKIKGSELVSLLDSDKEDDEKYINKLRNSIKTFIKQYGKVDAVVLTGGASQMAFYKEVVLECYGLTENECVVDRSPSYSISQGTAIMGYLDTKNPTRGSIGDPEKLTELLNRIPEVIESEVTRCTIDTYKEQLLSIVDQWESKEGSKTLRELYNQVSFLLASWDEHYDQISASTNKEVAESLSKTINDSLNEMMKLYFGYNMQMPSIELNYDFSMTLPEDSSLLLLKGIAKNIVDIINHSGLFRRFEDPEDWDKDRSGDLKLLAKLTHGTRDYIAQFFDGHGIDMQDFNQTIEECKKETRKFYYECIRKITCQV